MEKWLAGLSNSELLEDARRLYLEEGCSSMFVYCQRVLHFAEGVAYKRIQAARAARCHPLVVEAIRRGELHLTAIGLLAPKLTKENCAELIAAARHKSADEIRQLLADREPRPEVPTMVRRLPVPASSAAATPALPPISGGIPEHRAPVAPVPRAACAERGQTQPLGAERYSVQFTADSALYEQLQELRALMRHQVPDGDIAKIVSRAVALLLSQVRKTKYAETSAPKGAVPPSPKRVASRRIPAAIRRAVSQRDGARCTFVSENGRRCDSREFLEFDHVDAWTWSRVHSIEGIVLRCRAHNQQRARLDFGEAHMERFERRTGFESSSFT